MKLKKNIIIIFFVVVLLGGIFLIISERNNIAAKKSLIHLSQLIENGKASNLCLTIYYIDPSFLTSFPLSVELLVNSFKEDVVYVNNLERHIDLLKQLSSDVLKPVEHKSRIDARIYYIIKTQNNRKIFDVAMWGDDYSIYVNGLEVKSANIFYDIIMPFLPNDIAEYLEFVKDDVKWENDDEELF